MELIKEQYGPDAMIMDVKENNLNGHGWTKKGCEISVAIDEEKPSLPEDNLGEMRRGSESVWDHTLRYMGDRFASMETDMIRDRMRAYPLPLKVMFEKMEKNGLDTETALQIVSGVYTEAGSAAGNSIKAALAVKEGIDKRISRCYPMNISAPIVVLGPTGAGKTETAKKLASMFDEKKIPVSIIAYEPVRRSSYEELILFSEQTGIPIQFTVTVDDLVEKVCETSGMVIVDVTGQVDCQKEAVEALTETEKVIVLPAGISDAKAQRYLKTFESCNPVGVVFTKLDEEETPGDLCRQMFKFAMPVCFIAKGINQADMVIPDRDNVFKMLIEGVI